MTVPMPELPDDRYPEIGRVRMGSSDPIPGKPGGRQPKRLTEWRLTSPRRELLEAAAGHYGGRVVEWTMRPTRKPMQWVLDTETDALPVIVPRQELSRWYESWDRALCVRRCNLQTEILTGKPCPCKAELAGRGVEVAALRPAELAEQIRCDLHARLAVLLPDLPGLRLWRLDTQGWYSATGLHTSVRNVLPWLPDMTPVKLFISSHTVTRLVGGERVPFHFPVAVLDAPDVTAGELLQLAAARRQQALLGRDPVAAIAGRVADGRANDAARPASSGHGPDPTGLHPDGAGGPTSPPEAPPPYEAPADEGDPEDPWYRSDRADDQEGPEGWREAGPEPPAGPPPQYVDEHDKSWNEPGQAGRRERP